MYRCAIKNTAGFVIQVSNLPKKCLYSKVYNSRYPVTSYSGHCALKTEKILITY